MKQNRPKIFLDSGNPEETKKIKKLLGYLDGQTTNPSLVVKNPDVAKYLDGGKKLTESELLALYKQIIEQIAELVDDNISIEVNADWESTAEDLLRQAEDMFTWTDKANIKFPTTSAGIQAANEFVKKGGKVNMTLVFDQQQAAAVYAATLPAQHPTFISPFIGRWDDRGYNGMDVVKNIIRMYEEFDKEVENKHHVQVLAASIRNMDHLYASIAYGADILTIPGSMIEEWVNEGQKVPESYETNNDLKPIEYQDISFSREYKDYDIPYVEGSLLDEGLQKFAADWNKLLK